MLKRARWGAALLGLWMLGGGAAAEPRSVLGVNFESPDDPAWAEATIPNGILYEWRFANPQNGGQAAVLAVVSGTPGFRGDPALALPALMDAAGVLNGMQPIQEHKGTTTTGAAMAWALRGGSTGTSPSVDAVVTAVAFSAPEGLADAMLILINVDSASREKADRTFAALVRSLYMGPTPRPVSPSLPPGADTLDGLFVYTVTNFIQNPMGGSQMTMDWKLRQFDAGGLYADRPPLGGETLAALCASTPEACGAYRLDGGAMTMAKVDTFGLVETRTDSFERTVRGFQIDRYPYEPARPVPGPTLSGSWRFNYFAGGPGGSVTVIRQIDFTADGRYARSGFSGVTVNDPLSGTSGSTAGSDPEQAGRYTIDGFTLKLDSDAGKSELMSLVATDPADLSFVFLDGDSYARVGD